MDTDAIVVGAGPAGLSAAINLAFAGLRVIVLDMQATPGGQIFRALETNLADRPGTDGLLQALGPTYRAGQRLLERFRQMPGIDYRPGTTVWDVRADGTVGWLKQDQAGYLRAPHVILANGAMERPVPFPGWTLPGVMTAGAVQTLIKSGRLQPDGRVVLVGTGPLIFLLADQLRRLGGRPRLIARTDTVKDKLAALPKLRLSALPTLLKGLSWLARLRLAGVPMPCGITDLQAYGTEALTSVSMTAGGKRLELDCDLLVVHDGIVPLTDLAHSAGIALDWVEADASWRPSTAPDGEARLAAGPALTSGPCRVRITGDARLIGGADAAIAHGRRTARAILAERERLPLGTGATSTAEAAVKKSLAARPFIDAAFPPGLSARLPDNATIVCRCEEISAGALREMIRAGARDMNFIRGLTRCGMGPCQGRTCSATLARLVAETAPQNAMPPGPFRARPPVRPLPLIALANLSGVDPELAQVVSLEDKPDAAIEDVLHA
ncbi:FAD/NAD(P)-binding oxidoreductase [Ensifer sp. NM-2]|uniref:FAD/NAD(P)-dependent oxidoreductase n=1 Tax=Ensifer sp. NM-2 TaxID=2109730 RepID=UPI000D13B2E6|nr:NAD(P)/FAD-dependent oxidoreductase [Ensifer sp. NM-2]PSS59737.1 FAD/NAD(P)-binding oxidoreductase [Ensifer sp. NM-2]